MSAHPRSPTPPPSSWAALGILLWLGWWGLLWLGLPIWSLLLLLFLVTVALYALAALLRQTPRNVPAALLIALNTGINALLLAALWQPMALLAGVNALAIFPAVARQKRFQQLLGHCAWLLPMSWLATLCGAVACALSVLPALIIRIAAQSLRFSDETRLEGVAKNTGCVEWTNMERFLRNVREWNAVRITSLPRFRVQVYWDWPTGTLMTVGGWLFLPGFQGGYNLGNFAFVTPGSGVEAHETGHTLSNAAFGSLFHFIGAFDELWVQAHHADAYAERLAESHNRQSRRPGLVALWGQQTDTL